MARIGILGFVLSLSLAFKAEAQTMDPAQIVSQLLNQYQNELEGQDVETALGNVSEMSELSGMAGISAFADKLKSFGNDFMKGASEKFRPMVDPEIADKLDDVGAVQEYAKDKLQPSSKLDEANVTANTQEANEKAEAARQSAVLEAYGSSIATKALSKEAAENQDTTTEDASTSDSARDNVQMLTGITIQCMKQLAQIQTMESSGGQMNSFNVIRTTKKEPESEEKPASVTDQGSWSN